MKAVSEYTISAINDGAQGPQGVSVTKVVPEYRLSTSMLSLVPDDEHATGDYVWSETKPNIPAPTTDETTGETTSYYLWTRNRNNMSSGVPSYSDPVCDVVISTISLDVDQLQGEIQSKVGVNEFETYVTGSSTITTMNNNVSSLLQDVNGIKTDVLDVTTTTDQTTGEVTYSSNRLTSIEQTAGQISLMASASVDGQTQQTTVTLTPAMISAVSGSVSIQDPDGSETIIQGGRIETGAITTDMIATGAITTNTLDARAVTTAKLDTDAIKSTNYSAPTTATEPYSAAGTFLDLANGNIYSPNFMLDNTNSAAYFNGQVVADSGSIGGWEISDKQIYSSVTIGNKEHSVFLRKYDDSAIIATTSSYNMTVNYNSNGEFELTPTQDGSGSFSFTYNISDYPTKILYVYDSYSIDRDQRVNLEFYQNGEYSAPVADSVVLKYTTGEQTVRMSSYTQTGGSIRVTIRYTNMAVSDGKYIVKLKITNLNDEEYTIATGTSVSDASLGVTVIGIGQKTATGVVSYPFSVNRRGELFAYNAHINGEVRATSGSFTGTVNATNGSFNGAITAQSGTIGGYTIVQGDTAGTTETTANDGHVYQTGLYVHSSDGTYEYETGIRGSSTDEEDEAFYVRRIAQDGTWDSSTPNFYVKNNGYLYANNADITGTITATSGSFNGNITAQGGTIGGFNIKKGDSGCADKTSANGGHAYPNSLYVHNADDTYEYETGIKGETSSSNPNTLAFYVTRITKGGNWQTTSNGGTRTDIFRIGHGGTLYCSNADITGKITATSGSFKGDVTASTLTAKNTLYLHNSSGTKKVAITAPDSSFGSSLSIGTGFSALYLAKQTVIGGSLMVYEDGTGPLTCGSITCDKVNIDSVSVTINNTTTKRQGRFTCSDAGNVGLWDVTNQNWIIVSNSDFEVRVPHVFYSYGLLDTTQRSPVGSSNVANQGVSWLGGTATSTLSIRAQWNASSPATKTVAVSSSDIRLKKDIVDSQVDALEVINRVKLREFTWKDDGVRQKIGVVVDELEELDPLLSVGGGEDEDGNPIYKSVNNLLMISYLTKAVQQLSAQVDSLQNEIKELKGDK